MKFKRILCFILMLAMLASMMAFIGCGNNYGDDDDDDDDDRPKKTTEESTPLETPAPEPEEPERKAMSSVDLIAYARPRTVTVYTQNSRGSGFFIDDQGTIVTNYHVIDGANSLQVQTSNGNFEVESILGFDVSYDIAVLKIKMNNESLYFEQYKGELLDGEDVYAVGSPAIDNAISTRGIISKTSTKVGRIDCIVSDAVINPGNSGGPLINAYGEVVGINTFKHPDVEGLSLSININILDRLELNKNWDISKYRDWYSKEIQRSYKFYFTDGKNYGYDYSKIYTYQEKTGENCMYSSDEFVPIEQTGSLYNGYLEEHQYYYYDYTSVDFDRYTEYLFDMGFTLAEDLNEANYVGYAYYEKVNGMYINIYIVANDYMIIEPYYG